MTHDPGVGFAGLDDEETVEATAAIAAGVTTRVWAQAVRAAARTVEANTSTSR